MDLGPGLLLGTRKYVLSINWHTKSQGPKKKCTRFTRGRIHPCPAHTAHNLGNFTPYTLWFVESFNSSTLTVRFRSETKKFHTSIHLFDSQEITVLKNAELICESFE